MIKVFGRRGAATFTTLPSTNTVETVLFDHHIRNSSSEEYASKHTTIRADRSTNVMNGI
jgi:hypothetical protein